MTRLEELRKQYQDIVVKVQDAWENVLPQLKKLYNEVIDTSAHILDAVANVAVAYLKALIEVINEHQKELKELAVVVSELMQDVAKVVFKAASQIRNNIDEFVTVLMDQLKALPVYEIIKEKYNEILKFQIPQNIMESIDEISHTVKTSLPTKELQEFFDALHQYIAKHAKHEKVGLRIASDYVIFADYV